jgi:hypothetical protein
MITLAKVEPFHTNKKKYNKPMIQFTKSYKTDDGKTFGTIEEAQEHEISVLLIPLLQTNANGTAVHERTPNGIAKHLLNNKTVLIDILTTTPNSKPKARSSHGGTKTRKKTVITDATTTVAGVNQAI